MPIRHLILAALAVAAAGCIMIGGGSNEQASRTQELSAPMAPGALLTANSANGSFTVRGDPTDTCCIVATITAQASTVERAQELADGTQVRLEAAGQNLATVIDFADKSGNESIGVSFDIRLPQQASINLHTSNGNVRADLLTGEIKIRTSNGNVDLNQVAAGRVDLETSNGNVHLKQLHSANVRVHTSNGQVHADLISPASAAAADVEMTTSNGNMSVQLGPDFSARLDASTSNGKVVSGAVLTTIDRKTKEDLQGTIGAGAGRLVLRTSNGSIDIR